MIDMQNLPLGSKTDDILCYIHIRIHDRSYDSSMGKPCERHKLVLMLVESYVCLGCSKMIDRDEVHLRVNEIERQIVEAEGASEWAKKKPNSLQK